jgi:hypothetical protein
MIAVAYRFTVVPSKKLAKPGDDELLSQNIHSLAD